VIRERLVFSATHLPFGHGVAEVHRFFVEISENPWQRNTFASGLLNKGIVTHV